MTRIPFFFQRAAIALAVASFSYCNLAVIGSLYTAKLPFLAWPLPAAVYDAFLIFGIFSYYQTTNQEVTVWGLSAPVASQEPYWKLLSTDDFFPHKRGEQFSRLWASRHYRLLGRDGHWQAWQFMGQKILARYNRLHPSEPITKVALQTVTWPRSTDGFYIRRDPTAPRQYWVIAESPPTTR